MQGRRPSCSQVIAVALLYGATPAAFPDNATSPPSAVGAANPDGPAQGCKPGSENEGLYARLKDSYQEHLAWNGGDPDAPPAMIVGGGEIPESNPPWPYSTWNIGGSETIGVDNRYYSALMDALY